MRRTMPLPLALILVALAALTASARGAAELHLPVVIARPPAQPSPIVSATATSIPAPATATNTPTVIPSPTEYCYAQLLENPSFEAGLEPWSIQYDTYGDLSPVSAKAEDGDYSLRIGGRLKDYQVLVQDIGPVPEWAETGAAYFSWFMETDEVSTNHGYDCLFMKVDQSYPGGSFIDVESEGFCSNDTQGVWTTTRVELPATALRRRNLRVTLEYMGDHSQPTTWYVDNVRVVFACGGKTP